MRCPKCNTNWAPGTRSCDICGTVLQPKGKQPAKKRKRKRKPTQAASSGSTPNRIFGGIGIARGGFIIVSNLIRGINFGGGAYAAGQMMGLLFGVLLFGAGIYYVVKG